MNEFDKLSWVADARALLAESADTLDAPALSRLNRARQAALAQRQPRLRAWWLPAAGLAASCVLVLAVVAWFPPARPGVAPIVPAMHAAASDAEIAAADDSIEFYQDLEFYAWLDAQEQDSDG
jgi:anti-sigma-K factor RskA